MVVSPRKPSRSSGEMNAPLIEEAEASSPSRDGRTGNALDVGEGATPEPTSREVRTDGGTGGKGEKKEEVGEE